MKTNSVSQRQKAVVVGICLVVGALHFVTGKDYSGPFRDFVNGYLIDILLPTCVFLLLGFLELAQLKSRLVRVIITFAIGATVETLQYFDMHVFGSTFDPLDYAMYAIGPVLGAVLEIKILSKL